jgi:hypothetical protein
MSKVKLEIEVGGIIYGGLVAVYSILLAFVVVVVWQGYENTGDRIEVEASKVFNLYRSSYAFSDSTTAKIQRAVIDYSQSVVNDEWPALAHDTLSKVTQQKYNKVWEMIYDVKPRTESEKIWYQSMVQSANQFGEARMLRISDMDSSIPNLMWQMLFTGAVLIIVFASFFKSVNTKLHFIKVIMLSTIIIFSLCLINLLDHPFKGALQLEPTAFEKILNHYKQEQK